MPSPLSDFRQAISCLPDNITQMLRKAPRGTRSVRRQAENLTQISDQQAATLYRRTATALLRAAHRWLCL